MFRKNEDNGLLAAIQNVAEANPREITEGYGPSGTHNTAAAGHDEYKDEVLQHLDAIREHLAGWDSTSTVFKADPWGHLGSMGHAHEQIDNLHSFLGLKKGGV